MALGLGVAFVGYWFAIFGIASLRGPGVGFVDLIVPGRNPIWPAGGTSGGDGSGSPYVPTQTLMRLSCKQLQALNSTQVAQILKTNPEMLPKFISCGIVRAAKPTGPQVPTVTGPSPLGGI